MNAIERKREEIASSHEMIDINANELVKMSLAFERVGNNPIADQLYDIAVSICMNNERIVENHAEIVSAQLKSAHKDAGSILSAILKMD